MKKILGTELTAKKKEAEINLSKNMFLKEPNKNIDFIKVQEINEKLQKTKEFETNHINCCLHSILKYINEIETKLNKTLISLSPTEYYIFFSQCFEFIKRYHPDEEFHFEKIMDFFFSQIMCDAIMTDKPATISTLIEHIDYLTHGIKAKTGVLKTLKLQQQLTKKYQLKLERPIHCKTRVLVLSK